MRPIIAGNWKMHKTIPEAEEFVRALVREFPGPVDRDIIVAPPFTALSSVARIIAGSAVSLSAQNLCWKDQGAFTGEISAGMLLDAGCRHVIIGHSERRNVFGETDELINRKLKAALASGLLPIFCLGEKLEEREAGKELAVLERLLKQGLNTIEADDIRRLIVAYEPVWAIGTGRNATPEQAQQSHAYIRRFLKDNYGKQIADAVPILYGGSVTPGNIRGIMREKDVNGVLVGGASLDFGSFVEIIRFDS